jgi:hypothetical protein
MSVRRKRAGKKKRKPGVDATVMVGWLFLINSSTTGMWTRAPLTITRIQPRSDNALSQRCVYLSFQDEITHYVLVPNLFQRNFAFLILLPFQSGRTFSSFLSLVAFRRVKLLCLQFSIAVALGELRIQLIGPIGIAASVVDSSAG